MMTLTTILLQKYRPMSFPQLLSGNPDKTNTLDARLRTSGMTYKREKEGIFEIKFIDHQLKYE